MADGSLLNFIPEEDLYVLFANALDNAIESVIDTEEKEKRLITLQIKRKNNFVYVHMENYCEKNLTFEDGLPLSTKENKKYHGYGVRSIDYLVKKYKGELTFQLKDRVFNLNIVFLITNS